MIAILDQISRRQTVNPNIKQVWVSQQSKFPPFTKYLIKVFFINGASYPASLSFISNIV